MIVIPSTIPPLSPQKPKWKQTTFWLTVIVALVNLWIAWEGLNNPEFNAKIQALNSTGLLSTLLTVIFGGTTAYTIAEKAKDAHVTKAIVEADTALRQTEMHVNAVSSPPVAFPPGEPVSKE